MLSAMAQHCSTHCTAEAPAHQALGVLEVCTESFFSFSPLQFPPSFFLSFLSTGVQGQDFTLAKQALSYLSQDSSPQSLFFESHVYLILPVKAAQLLVALEEVEVLTESTCLSFQGPG
jgi:hypothetical protein